MAKKTQPNKPEPYNGPDYIRLVLQIKDTPGNRIMIDHIREEIMKTRLPDPTQAVFKMEQTHIIAMASTKQASCLKKN